jgi:hypothetical protein
LFSPHAYITIDVLLYAAVGLDSEFKKFPEDDGKHGIISVLNVLCIK